MVTLAYPGLDRDRLELAGFVHDAASATGDDPFAGNDLGWSAIGVPEADGGSGGTLEDVAVLVEQVAALDAATVTPWLAGVVAPLVVGTDLVAVLAAGATMAIALGPPWEVAAALGGPGAGLSGWVLALGAPTAGHVAVPVGDDELAVIPLAAAAEVGPAGSIDVSRRSAGPVR